MVRICNMAVAYFKVQLHMEIPRKTMKNVRTGSNPAKIQTGYLQNASVGCYRFTNLLSERDGQMVHASEADSMSI
jgi:hypothetical protein